MKDSRYKTVQKLILGGHIKLFSEVLETIPKTRLALDLKINPERFNRILGQLDLFVIKDLIKLAELLEVESIKVLILVDNELIEQKKKPKRGK